MARGVNARVKNGKIVLKMRPERARAPAVNLRKCLGWVGGDGWMKDYQADIHKLADKLEDTADEA